MTPALGDHALIVVTGKGGVGKSTITAALAWRLAQRGRRTLALETDPRETLHRLLDADPSDGAIVDVANRLWLQNARPRQEIEALVRHRIPVPLVARAVAASPIFHHFVEGAPGLKELAVLGHALRLTRGETGPGVDTVVLDAPATGHGVSLLTAPGLVAEAIGAGPVADLAGEIAALVQDAARCGVVVVTLAEEMPVQESIELAAALTDRVGRAPDGIIVNQLYPPFDRDASGPDTARTLWRDRRAVNDAELKRLRGAWTGPLLELPLVPAESGPALTHALADRCDAWLAGAP